MGVWRGKGTLQHSTDKSRGGMRGGRGEVPPPPVDMPFITRTQVSETSLSFTHKFIA